MRSIILLLLCYFYIQLASAQDYTIAHFTDKNESIEKHRENFPFLIDKNKTLWTSKGSEVYQISSALTKRLKTHQFPTTINYIYEGPDHEIWLGGEEGIFKMAANENSFTAINELSSIKKINYLKKGNDRLWIGTHTGLLYFDFKTKKTLEVKELNNKEVRNIIIRGEKTWITTHDDGYHLYANNKLSPRFYQTWWFILSLLLFYFLIVYIFTKTRTKTIRRRNKLLEVNIQERTKELQSTIKAYETSQNKLENQFYFQRQLIAAITHDIKSPLRYLMMTGEALYKNEQNEKVDREGLKAIYTSSSQIYHFTDNLLSYAKGVTNEVVYDKVYFNLNDLIEEKMTIFQPIANAQTIKIYNLVETNVKIKSNKQLLAVILHNLLDNALKFTSSGEITFSYETIAEYSKILVKDSGKGISAAQAAWCNEPQTAEMMKNKYKVNSSGGLGLIIVKKLLQIIGGKIHVEGVAGKGTTFELILKNEI